MTSTELLSLESPVEGVSADEVPAALLGRAIAYNAAVDAFRESIRGALYAAEGGHSIDARKADALRALANDLATARAWLLRSARLPAGSQSC